MIQKNNLDQYPTFLSLYNLFLINTRLYFHINFRKPSFIIYRIIEETMGNCSDTTNIKHMANSLFNFAYAYEQTSHLMFFIKAWPSIPFIKVTSTEAFQEQIVETNVEDGEQFQIVLKSFVGNEVEHQDSKELFMFRLNCQVYKIKSGLRIEFPEAEQRQFLWRSISQGIEIKEKDTVRMGRTKYILSKVLIQRQMNNYKSIKSIKQCASMLKIQQSQDETDTTCRICLQNQQTQQNPFVCPCKCTGSVKYTHLKCLALWLFDFSLYNLYYPQIKVKKSICQICKTDIAGTKEYEKMKDLLISSRIDVKAPYAIFQISPNTESNEPVKEINYFILSFQNKKQYSIGRSKKADICDAHDKCLSKINSLITFQDNKIYIKDCDSTHGTFLKMKKVEFLSQEKPFMNIVYRNMIIKANYDPNLRDLGTQ